VAIAKGEYVPGEREPQVWFHLGREFRQGALDRNRDLCRSSRNPLRVAGRAGGADRPAEVEPLSDIEDHGALRFRPTETRGARCADPASALQRISLVLTAEEAGGTRDLKPA